MSNQQQFSARRWRAPPTRLPPLDMQNVKDAESVIFKAFGASRKLSERDKRHLAKIIAVNSQIAQQELVTEANSLSRRVNSAKQKRRRLERSLASLNTKLISFIDNNKQTFTNKLVDTRSTSDVLLISTSQPKDSKEADVIQQLDQNVMVLLDKFARLIIEARLASSSSGIKC